MAINDAMDDRRRAQEEDYFRRQDKAAVERMRQRAEREQERARLAEASGITDESFLDELQNARFTPETLPLVPLLPLVETAWAEGRTQGSERRAILEVAEQRGITAEHPAYSKLKRWLTDRPSDEFFERARSAFTLMLRSLPLAERESEATKIVAACVRVARASGGIGFFDLGRSISDEEHLVLERIIGDLAGEGISPEEAGSVRA